MSDQFGRRGRWSAIRKSVEHALNKVNYRRVTFRPQSGLETRIVLISPVEMGINEHSATYQ